MMTFHMILRSIHITAGALTLATGLAAMSFSKGSWLHRKSGNVFFVSMLVLSVAGVVLTLIDPNPNMGNIMGGTTAFYMVATAWATVIRPAGKIGRFEILGALMGVVIAGGATTFGILAMMAPNNRFHLYPPLMYFVFAGIIWFATALDVRMIRRGGLTGPPRTTRHLWRMSLAFFMATGSFFFGQPRFVPTVMRETGLFIVAGLLPIGLMIYFLVKTRVVTAILHSGRKRRSEKAIGDGGRIQRSEKALATAVSDRR